MKTLKIRDPTDHNIVGPPEYEISSHKQIFFILDRKLVKKNVLKVKITEDFNKIVLSCGKDSYELAFVEGEYIQKMVSFSDDSLKIINEMMSCGHDLYYLVNCDFDTEYQIKCSND